MPILISSMKKWGKSTEMHLVGTDEKLINYAYFHFNQCPCIAQKSLQRGKYSCCQVSVRRTSAFILRKRVTFINWVGNLQFLDNSYLLNAGIHIDACTLANEWMEINKKYLAKYLRSRIFLSSHNKETINFHICPEIK